MDLHLTPAQQLLVNTAREFLRRQCPASAMAESVASERGFSAELWKEISVLGWTGLLVSTEYGGSGGGMLDVALLLEEMGRACFPSRTCRARWWPRRSLPTAAAPRSVNDTCLRWLVASASASSRSPRRARRSTANPSRSPASRAV